MVERAGLSLTATLAPLRLQVGETTEVDPRGLARLGFDHLEPPIARLVSESAIQSDLRVVSKPSAP